MVKRKTQPIIDSESSSDSGSGSDLDSELLSLAKKKKTTRLASNSPGGKSSDSDSEDDSEPEAAVQRKKRGAKPASSSESEDEEEEEEDEEEEDEPEEEEKPAAKGAVKRKQPDEEEKKGDSEPEEGQVSSEEESGSGSGDDSDDESGSSSSSDSEFNDGYDDEMMGDEDDRARLNALSEKERETEIFKRIERRDVMKTRWEIERKLKLAKKAERAKDKESQPPKKKKKKDKKKKLAQQKEQEEKKKAAKAPTPEPKAPSPPPPVQQPEPSEGEASDSSHSSPEKSKDADSDAGGSDTGASEYFDPKERSKERKKNVEANRTDDKRSNAMAMLKAKREGKAKREEEEAKKEAQRKAKTEDKDDVDDVPGGKSSKKLKASDIYSDDSGSDSETDKKSDRRSRSGSSSGSGSDSRSSSDEETWDKDPKEPKEKKPSSSSSSSSKKPAAISNKEELNKLRISRHKIERFIALPMFDQIVLNCFVRINIGNNNGRPVYRVAEIVGVVETAKIYQFGKCRTNKGFRLKHGSQERVFRLEFISNQDFTDTEYQKWLSVCEATGTPLPYVDVIEKKQQEIKEAIQYEFKDADIDKLIEEKNRFRAHPTNYAMKKTLLMKERDAAQLRGEDELARDLNTQIMELEERASSLDKRRSSSISLISYINDRNRKRNVEDAEKAIKEEIRATRGLKIEDPFTRRQTQPRMSFKASDKKDEVPTIQMPAPPPPGQKKKPDEKKASSSADNNLYSLHDFDIDLDVPLPIGSVNVLPKPVEKAVKESGPKRSLNLEDYKKKRGLI